MTDSSPLFADRILNVAVTGPLVRIELGTAQVFENGKDPQFVATRQVVMPIEGFVNSFGLLDQVMKKLVETGVLKVRADAGESAATSQ